MTAQKRITVACGDGIGPEIMDSVLRVLEAAKAPLEYDHIEIGEAVYKRGMMSGISPEAWDTLRRNKVFLKAPITTPQGGGYKSLNVTIRKSLALFANVRECKAYGSFVTSTHPTMNMVIVRENEEDLYAGIEHRQTDEVVQCLKLVSRPGIENIVRFAFEYARAYGRRKVTCMTKDNIMKQTDGLFHAVFDEIAKEYGDIENEHQIIDIGAARVAAQPERLDVVVTLNLYGDILSDIAAQVAGSVGLAGSANVGREHAMFEAIHGSAPDIAGRNVANPSGLLLAATQMLVHLDLAEYAETIKNAWLCTLEEGIHTADIFRDGLSDREVGTTGFTDAVIERLGKKPRNLSPVHYKNTGVRIPEPKTVTSRKELTGVDLFIHWSQDGRNPDVIGRGLQDAAGAGLKLKMITNRGVKVFPEGLPETFCTDHWRCRFIAQDGGALDFAQLLELQKLVSQAGFDIIKTENLYTFDGERGYSLGQGE